MILNSRRKAMLICSMLTYPMCSNTVKFIHRVAVLPEEDHESVLKPNIPGIFMTPMYAP